MSPENLLDDAIKSIKGASNTISSKYDEHIREKAIEKVDSKIHELGIEVEQIEKDDYEVMISDLSKDIKEDYAKKTSQGLLAFIGLDMLFGL